MSITKRKLSGIQFETTNEELDDGYLWADKEKMKEITLSGPHRKWIEEISPR